MALNRTRGGDTGHQEVARPPWPGTLIQSLVKLPRPGSLAWAYGPGEPAAWEPALTVRERLASS